MKPAPAIALAAGSLVGAALIALLTVILGEADPAPASPSILNFAAVLSLLHLPAALIVLRLLDREGNDSPRLFAAVLVSLTLIGFGLRFIHLGRYAFGNDESLFVFAAGHETLADSLRDMLTHFHPPTNFLLIRLLLSVSWDPVWVRLPAVIGGTLAIPFTYLLVRELFGRPAGLIAAFLVTYSPNLILLSQVCRNYSPGLPFYLVSLFYLARFLKDGSMRALYGFALFELLSVIWHYALLPVYLAANLLLFVKLAASPRPLQAMGRAVAAQVPVGAIYLTAVLFHQPLTQAGQQEKVRGYMVQEFNLNPLDPLDPIVELFRYLFGDSPAMGPFVLAMGLLLLAGFGSWQLAKKGFRWQVGLCLAFLPFSYLFAFVLHVLPFGGTRHSYYVYPMFFALVSGALAWMLTGRHFSAASAGSPAPAPAGEGDDSMRMGRAALVMVLCGLYLFSSMRLYSNVTPYAIRQSPSQKEPTPYYKANFYKIVELPTRMNDIRDIRQGVLAYTRPGEIVLTSITTQMTLRAHLMDPPPPMFFSTRRPAHFEWEGRLFLYVPEAQFVFTPDSLLVTVDAVARERGLPPDSRIWVAMVGWEVWPGSLPSWTQVAYPDIYLATGAAEATRDLLFAVGVDAARVHTAAILEAGPPARD